MTSKFPLPTKTLSKKPIAWILNSGSRVSRKGLNLVVQTCTKEKRTIHIKQVSAIILVAPHSLTPQAIELCARLKVPLLLSNSNFRVYASLVGLASGSRNLTAQILLSKNPILCLEFCRKIVLQKINNQKHLLKRYSYHAKGQAKLTLNEIAKELLFLEEKIALSNSVESLRGLEGYASKIYFSSFNYLIRDKTGSFNWQKRTRKPPKDNINAVLSFSYFIGLNLVLLFLFSKKVNPSIGVLHAIRKTRPSLALDLIEVIRPLCDRICLTLINRKQLRPNHFQNSDDGVLIDREGIKIITSAFNKRINNILDMVSEEYKIYELLCSQSAL